MRPAIGLTLILIGIALEWVAMHGYDMSTGGFRGVVEGLYDSIHRATTN